MVELPTDFTTEIPTKPYQWIIQYLYPQELIEHLVGWSHEQQRLIFPVYEKRTLKLWTGRYFGTVKDAPKYLTMGNRNEVLDVVPSEVMTDRVVLVEDKVSAIKVARVCSSVPIYGTNIPLEHARKLSKRFSQLWIWLDPDAKQQSLKQAVKLSSWFPEVRCVFSDKDPKVYTTKEISKFLGAV